MESKKSGKSVREVVASLWLNTKRTIRLAWLADKKLFSALFFVGLISGLFPIALGFVSRIIIDKIVAAQTTTTVISIALLSVFALRYLINLIQDLIVAFQYDYVDRLFDLRLENFLTLEFTGKLAELDLAHFENAETQTLLQKARQAHIWRIQNFIYFLLSSTVSLATFVGAFVVLLPFGIWIPMLMVAATLPRFYLRTKYSQSEWSVFHQNTIESKELGYVSDLLDDPVSAKEIKILQAGPAILERIKNLQKKILDNLRGPIREYMSSLYVPITIETATLGALSYIELGSAVTGLLTIGAFTFYIQMLDRISSSAKDVLSSVNRLYDNNLYVDYHFDVLALPKLVKESTPGIVFDELKPPKIEFQNVSFDYPGGTHALKNITFALEPGEHLAIVGANGAGKSTLIKLLLRFYDPTRGQIMVNDYNLRELRLDNWYKFVGTLFQDFVKFFLTIRENILLGNTDVIDEDKMKRAAEKSGAAEFIEKFPKKYEQRLGKKFDDAVELSQGQWQKLALARAFYEEAPILILDEPTSAIDSEAEAAIFENLDEAYKDKTLILVSHRFSTVKNADKIIVLKDGAIEEQGNHHDLMKQDGIYARMFRKQAKGYID